ncbi:MAG: chemotaxis protein CheW [candidate division NC10 bacterium]|nr:chemotaxis protein CheW [candidate division NC10 bacterium]
MRDREAITRGLGKEEGEPCLLFLLGGETYGIRVRMLREIVGPAKRRRLPSDEFKYCEELDYRGNRVPVIRLCDFFGYKSPPDAPQSVLVIEGERPFGLLVDSVKGVWNVRDSQMKPLPQLATSLNPQYIRGIAKVEGKITFFLNEDQFPQTGGISSFYGSSEGQEEG